jgi:hypothetical protein
MQYMILCYERAEDVAKRDDPEAAPAYWAGWSAYAAAVAEAGILVSAAGLMPSEHATTVRVTAGARTVHDGPYADSKEQLGGFFLIDVPDLDAALDWAARSPSAAYAATEVRPVLPRMPD